MPLYYPPTQNFVQKTVNATFSAGATTVTLSNTTAIQNASGVFIVDRVDANGVETASKREVISYTGTSGSTLTGLTRGLAGTSDQDHAVGAIVEFVPDIIQQQALVDALANLVNTSTLAIDTTKIVTPTGTQTLTNKTITAPVISTITNTGTITLPTSTDTLVGRDTTDTLTNKTLSSPVLSGSSPTTEAKLGWDSTAKAILVGNGSATRKIYADALTTYTPTVSSTGGTITTASATGAYGQYGKLMYVTITVSITTNGTGSGGVIASLPFTAGAAAVFVGRANAVSGKMLQGVITASGTTVNIFNYDNSYPGASGESLILSGWVSI